MHEAALELRVPAGEKALSSRLIKGEFIAKTNSFYAKYGGKTIVLARFVPIIRTFAPFVAGVGAMHYPRFLAFNVVGALVWTLLFTGQHFAAQAGLIVCHALSHAH